MAGSFFTKAVGLAALTLAGYDTLATTKDQAPRYAQFKELKRLDDTYLRTDALTPESVLGNKMQNWSRNHHLGSNWLYKIWDNTTSYISCFFDNLGNNLLNMGLGLTALLTGRAITPAAGTTLSFAQRCLNKINLVKVPFVGAVAACILAVKAGAFVLHDLFGIFASDPRKNKFS